MEKSIGNKGYKKVLGVNYNKPLKLAVAILFVIIQESCITELMAYSIAVTPELDKKRESLPVIFEIIEGYADETWWNVGNFDYLNKYYGANAIQGEWGGFWNEGWAKYKKSNKGLEDTKRFQFLTEVKKHEFLKSIYQGGTFTPLNDDLPLPDGVDENGNKIKTSPFSTDQISPLAFTNYIQPKIDLYNALGFDILRLGEYGFYFRPYSITDIEQFRLNLLNKDEGIEWQFHDGHIEKLHFWGYARAQLGIKKEDFRPESLGDFTSYSEYVPVKFRGGGDQGDFLGYIFDLKYVPKAYGSGEKYWRNVNLLLYLYEYEYFKRCQSWFKYAKHKGFKYVAWGPNGQFYRDTPHDPYVDYMDVRIGQGRIAMLPTSQDSGYGGYSSDPRNVYAVDGGKIEWRYLRTTSTMLGKPGLVSYENAHLGRLNISPSYEVGFGQVLVLSTLAKPKYFMTEFSFSDVVFDSGLPYSLRQSTLCGVDAYRQVIASQLYKGSLLKSNWLILLPVLHYKTFGYQGFAPRANFGDMRYELFHNEGYIPDADPSNGMDGVPLDDYKVITMGGTYYNPIAIDRLEKWIKKDSGRTLFTNYLYLGRYLWGYDGINGERYKDLGIWKTQDVVEKKIEFVTWTDKNILPNVMLGDKYSLRAALPAVDIMGNLPSGARVIMKGRTVEGMEVPLVVILPKGQNRMINVVFAMDEYTFSTHDEYLEKKRNANLELGKEIMQDLFAYIQKEDNFSITRVKCEYPGKWIFREIARDNRGVATLCALVSPGADLGLTLVDPLILEYENHKVVTKVKNYSPVIASVDGSVLVSCSAIVVDDIQYVKQVVPETIYVLATLDDKGYHDSELFHLWTYEPTSISLLKPKTWKDEKMIKIYSFDPEAYSAIEVPFNLKDGYIELKTKGALEAKMGFEAKSGVDYKICYGKPEESLWKEFCKRLSDHRNKMPETRFDDSEWKRGSLIDMPAIQMGWYRLHVMVPKAWQGDSLILDLGTERYGMMLKTYFNGKHQNTDNAEKWSQTNIQRRYIISRQIVKPGEDNVIAVQVRRWSGYHPISDGSIRLINPAKGEEIDLSRIEWLSKEGLGEQRKEQSWGRY